jgi:hypothetical protein
MAEKAEVKESSVKVLKQLVIGSAPFVEFRVGRQYVWEEKTYSNKEWKEYKATVKAALGQAGVDDLAPDTQYRFGVQLGTPDYANRLNDMADFGYTRIASVVAAAVAEADEAEVEAAFTTLLAGGWIKILDGERVKAAAKTKISTVEDDAVNRLALGLIELKGMDAKDLDVQKRALAKAKELQKANHKLYQTALADAVKAREKKYAGLDEVGDF